MMDQIKLFVFDRNEENNSIQEKSTNRPEDNFMVSSDIFVILCIEHTLAQVNQKVIDSKHRITLKFQLIYKYFSTGVYHIIRHQPAHYYISWWRHQMETFSSLLALCAGNSPVPVNSPHKGQWRGVLMFSLICIRINDWVNNREAGDLRRHRGHYDVNVMLW